MYVGICVTGSESGVMLRCCSWKTVRGGDTGVEAPYALWEGWSAGKGADWTAAHT